MATVGAHPAIVRWHSSRPMPPQQFAPVDGGLCRSFQSSVEAGWNLTRLFGNRRRLVDRYIPFPDLFLNGGSFLVGQRRIEDLTDSAVGRRSGRFVRVAGG